MRDEKKLVKTKLVHYYFTEILNIIENVEDYTQSDLQGAIMAVIMQALEDGKNQL